MKVKKNKKNMTRNGRKQSRRAMAPAHPLTKPFAGHNGTAGRGINVMAFVLFRLKLMGALL
jgi:hypothetical protein